MSSVYPADETVSSFAEKVSPPPQDTINNVAVCGVIGPTVRSQMQPCPCCNRMRSQTPVAQEEVRQTLNEPAARGKRQDIPCLFNCEDDDEYDGSNKEHDDDYLPGVLDSGVEYKFKRVLAEGWVNKKGTGKDWMGSRALKPRWARLVLAKVDGFDVDVPLLLIYWFRASPSPSTVILLDSTVVLPVDKDEGKTCSPYRFDVVHAKDENHRVTRTFSVPKKGRDQWVYAINSALLKYEKDCAQARRQAAALADLRPVHTSSKDSVLRGETFPDGASRPVSPGPSMSSPRSPLSPKRPLPRPDQLLGESLLGPEPLVGEYLLDSF